MCAVLGVLNVMQHAITMSTEFVKEDTSTATDSDAPLAPAATDGDAPPVPAATDGDAAAKQNGNGARGMETGRDKLASRLVAEKAARAAAAGQGNQQARVGTRSDRHGQIRQVATERLEPGRGPGTTAPVAVNGERQAGRSAEAGAAAAAAARDNEADWDTTPFDAAAAADICNIDRIPASDITKEQFERMYVTPFQQ